MNSPETLHSPIFDIHQLTRHSPHSNIGLPWAIGHNPQSNIGLPWAHRTPSRVQYWIAMSSPDILHTLILDSLEPLDTLRSLILGSHELTGHLPEYNIVLPGAHWKPSAPQYWTSVSPPDTLRSPILDCNELTGHPPQSNIELPWAHWTPSAP